MGDNNEKIKVKIEINAAIETVWKYWNEPIHIEKWYSASDDWHTPFAENDLRVNGRFKYRMEAKDGSLGFDFSGKYSEIKVYKFISYTLDDDRIVEITFNGGVDKTEITEYFEAESVNSIELQKNGWQAILENFKRNVEGA